MPLLQDRIVVVTGAGRGIGRAIAVAFAREGAKTAVTGRDLDRLAPVVDEIRAAGGEAQAFELDVTREDDAVRVAEEVVGTWGRIDVLVNNAGVIHYGVPVWATTVEQWDDVMDTNLRGMFLVCRAVVPHMMRRERGVIINIGSSSGRVPEGDYGAYVASKYGVVGYTASLAHSLRPYGIQVNGINPDWVDTDMARAEMPEGGPDWITPEQMAEAALYLAARAPSLMTGQFIDMFGV
ncbi:MAG: SDR family NAD(P)-dependent oxidoreductase [Chloroflexota bacterium]|nr:SDR family NAD(P)-dependent oxidoreductase [Chloroflexota bacterium]